MPKLARAVLVQPEAVHQRLGAVMPGAHRDALPVEQRRDIVRVRAVEREARRRRRDPARGRGRCTPSIADSRASAWSVSAASCAAIAS